MPISYQDGRLRVWTIAANALYICDMADHKSTPRSRLHVGFILAQDFTLSAFANFVDVLRLAADEGDRSRPIHCDWSVLSADMNPVRSSCGVKVQPDTRLRHAPRFDYIVVVGGLIGSGAPLPAELVAYLRAQAAAGVPLAGLCTGVFQLHEAGLLDGYRVCVSWFHHRDFTERFQGTTPVSDRIFVVDRDRLTCSGGHSTAHLAAFLVQRHIGAEAATKSLSILIIDGARPGDVPQPGPVSAMAARDPLVRMALGRLQQALDAPPTMGELASALDVSRKTLERRFRADIAQSPARAGLSMRLDRAEHLLRAGPESVTDIALSCGFCDASHLIRALKSERGRTPTQIRNQPAPLP